jgi:DNA (cytosine-5)-methyltransferase 1
MIYIDLFCGIGGFHQALKSLNCKCILASDIDKNCQDIYKLNYDIEVQKDVKKIDENSLSDFDIICAGFPCQTFSNAGKKKTFSDKRGLLFDEIIRIAKVKKPKFIFLENVKHILKVDDGNVIKYIETQLNESGYILQLFNMSPHNYGIPQQRERIYFVCVRKDIYNHIDIKLPIKDIKTNFENYLDKNVEDKYYIKGDILNVLEAWDELIKQFDIDEKISPTILINEYYLLDRKTNFDKYPKWKQKYIIENEKLINKYKNQFDEWYEKYKTLLSKREIYAKLEWQVGLIKPNDSIFNYFIQIRQSGIRVKKTKYFPTLVAISQIPIYGKEKRYITPRECARLQSFPDNFILSNNDKISYKQLGNAVNVQNVKTVVEATFKHYNIM